MRGSQRESHRTVWIATGHLPALRRLRPHLDFARV